jgi:hypothetical protein
MAAMPDGKRFGVSLGGASVPDNKAHETFTEDFLQFDGKVYKLD